MQSTDLALNSRRRFLRGVGTALALPVFESVIPARAFAEAGKGGARATTASGAPLRMGFIYFPNGAIPDKWRPDGDGAGYKLNQTMEPLAGMRDHFQVISGFAHKNGDIREDGAGDHARANATFLTGARAHKTAGSDIRLGISADQVAAMQVGNHTRLSSLELSCDGVRKSGSCDSGYSCAYQFNISWRSATTPMTPESNPRLVFERLFGAGDKGERQRNYAQRQARKKSLLDFVMEDAHHLSAQLGRNDRNKLDEYLTGVREIEQRIEKAERFGALPDPGVDAPDGTPPEYREHIRLMYDLLALAFETDSTRVATFLLAHDGSNRSFQEIGVSEGHHSLSHHRRDPDKIEKITRIDRFYAEEFAGFLERLNNKKDVDGKSVLENSMIVYGSGLSDADRHEHDDLPVILAGHGGGTLNPGRHLNLGQETPMTNLYMGMMEKMGVKTDRIGDSTGALGKI